MTTGKMSLVHVVPATGVDGTEALQLAAALGHASEHPIVAAIVAAAQAAGMSIPAVEGFLSTPGQGVRGSIRGPEVVAGRATWLMGQGSPVPVELVAALPLAASGRLNPLLAGAAMAFSGVFVVSNSLRLRRSAAWSTLDARAAGSPVPHA